MTLGIRFTPYPFIARLLTASLLASASAIPLLASPSQIVLWDTRAPFGEQVEVGDSSAWKVVPSDLIRLEKDPAKSASDPAYYGREYVFEGDAVVENARLLAALNARSGALTLFTKGASGAPSSAHPLAKVAEVVPMAGSTPLRGITRYEIVRNIGDEIVLRVVYPNSGTTERSAEVSFGKAETVQLNPGPGVTSFRIVSPLEYGVAPAFIGDDLLFRADALDSAGPIHVPAESFFVGLVKGEEQMLVMTWAKGKQVTRLNLAEKDGKQIESIDFVNDGQSLFLAALSAPGIWHREELTSAFLEKDMPLSWKRPYPARWKTELDESGVTTTFAFREGKGQVWRGVPGSYNYPVWFDAGRAFFHLSKKVPPKGSAVIYFLEGDNTPSDVTTPVDVLKSTLGLVTAEAILDDAGRKLRTHHRRGSEGVRRACTCGCTEAIQAIFESGEEVEQRAYIDGAVDDMIYFVRQHVARIDEYRRFADRMLAFLKQQGQSDAALAPYLESLEQVVQQIPDEYGVQKENMKSLEYADELGRKTRALTAQKDPGHVKAYMDLLKDWRAMGGAQDYVLARCHGIARQLFQEAGYRGVESQKSVELAEAVRAQCRQILRNADGYEIWPNY